MIPSASRVVRVRPAERPLGWAPMASAAAFMAYALGIPVLIGVGLTQTRPSWTGAALVLVIVAVYSAVRLAYELGTGASRWFVLAFHAFTYVFLGVVPLVQIGAQTLWWVVDPSPGVLLEAAIVCLASVLLFDVGLWLGESRSAYRKRRNVDQLSRIEERPDPRSASQRPQADTFSMPPGGMRSGARPLAFLLGLTVLSLFLFLMRGGLALVLASRSELDAALCSAQSSGGLVECGVLGALVRVPPVILMVVALGTRDQGHRSLTRLAIIVGAVSLLLTANPVSTARFWVGAVALGVLGATVIHSLRARVLIWLAVPALLILVFPMLDFGRDRGWSPDFSIRLETLTQKQDFDAFQQIANGITYVNTYGTRGGMQLSSAVLFFVPRSVWTDKAPATGSLVSASLGVTDNTNVSAPLWEEGYVDFGIAGVLVIMFAVGYVVARLEAAVERSSSRQGGLILVVAPFFAGYSVFLLRGSLLPAIGPLVVAVLLTWASSRLGPSPGQSSGHQTPTNDPVPRPGSLRAPLNVPIEATAETSPGVSSQSAAS